MKRELELWVRTEKEGGKLIAIFGNVVRFILSKREKMV